MPLTALRDILQRAVATLPGDSPRADAELLLAAAIGQSRTWLFAHDDLSPDADTLARFDTMLQRRRDGEPVALIIGRQQFWSLDLMLGAATLVPRPETERLVELALERIAPGASCDVLDLGTGSGAIALAIASERPTARVTGVDAAPEALAVATANATHLGIALRLLEGDWFSPVAGEHFELVLSNPPYLADADPHLADLRHEPRAALVSGPTGMESIEAIAIAARQHLRAGGELLMEHGMAQGAAVRAFLQAAGYVDVATWQDLEGRDRVSGGRWTGVA
ncbi:peptide chain release factor N(5)-glutamine methyltransferase [soil metagenome]